ncbi:zona pellucida sperm-binding protein 4 [Myotis yumanensis]|uniref:zona pellucida sperm-binding protein 4 n=1 Tax=Myotis yumanensis TaxID=159337 RepID=UPI0038D4F385
MWLCPLLLCLPLSLALSGQREPEAPEDAGELHCGPEGLQFTVHPLGQASGTPPALIAWDDHGLLHRLQNDSGCGTRVSAGPGSSLVLEASYGGCYVTEWGSQHIMPVGLEQGDTAGHRAVATAKLLKCPVGLPGLDALGAHLCDSVPVGDRLPCAPAPATPRACKALGCCYNPSGRSCYYGNTVTSRCSRDGRFAVAVARNVTSPPLLLDSVRLALGNHSECRPAVATPAFALFRFPVTTCGTTRRVTGDQAVYENELVAAQDVRTWSRGTITRDSTFRLRVSCTYPVSSSALPVNVQVSLLPPPPPETQPGALTLELQIAKDGNYSAYYRASDYPVVKLLRDPIYVEVALRHRTDPDLGLLLHQCWATPGPDPGQQPQWALLVNGCPYAGDNYRTQLIPVPETESLRFPSHAQRFSIFTFSFVDSGSGRALGGPVFLHCSVSVCQPAGSPSCVACPVTRRRRSSDVHDPNSTAFISSQGPMILLQATEDPSGKLPKYSSAAGDSGALWVAGLSGTVVVGVLGLTYLAVKKWS